jgi:hypothetical protein
VDAGANRGVVDAAHRFYRGVEQRRQIARSAIIFRSGRLPYSSRTVSSGKARLPPVPLQRFESLLAEMYVETEGFVQAALPHGLKTDTVYEAEILPAQSQNRVQGGAVGVFIYPFDTDQGQDIIDKAPQGGQAQAALKKCRGFEQHIIVR